MSNAAAVAAAKRRRGPTAQVSPPGTSNRPVNRVAGPPPTAPPGFTNSQRLDDESSMNVRQLSPMAIMQLNSRRLSVLETNYNNMSSAFNLYPDPRITKLVTNENLQESIDSITEPLYAKIDILEQQLNRLYELVKNMKNGDDAVESLNVDSLVPQLSNIMNAIPGKSGGTTIIYSEEIAPDTGEQNLKINFQEKPAVGNKRGGKKNVNSSEVPTFPR